MDAIKIHPLDLFEILSRVNSDPVEISLQRVALDGEPLTHYQDSFHEVDGVLYEQTITVPHKTTRFDDELRSLGLQPFHPELERACAERVDIKCGGANVAVVCGEPESAHTPEAARLDVGMDHDFIPATFDAEPKPGPALVPASAPEPARPTGSDIQATEEEPHAQRPEENHGA